MHVVAYTKLKSIQALTQVRLIVCCLFLGIYLSAIQLTRNPQENRLSLDEWQQQLNALNKEKREKEAKQQALEEEEESRASECSHHCSCWPWHLFEVVCALCTV